MGNRLQILPGQKFNLLTVVKELPILILPSGQSNRIFLCKCECGKETKVRLVHLCRDRIKSCGHLNGERHDPKYNKLYATWNAMKWRCKTTRHPTCLSYLNKGITLCEEWTVKFSVFQEWALRNGWKQGLEIDRKDWDKGYYPENCRFVNQIEQTNNRKVTIWVMYKGKKHALSMLMRDLNQFDRTDTVRARIYRGWNAEKAIDTPTRIGNYKRKNHA